MQRAASPEADAYVSAQGRQELCCLWQTYVTVTVCSALHERVQACSRQALWAMDRLKDCRIIGQGPGWRLAGVLLWVESSRVSSASCTGDDGVVLKHQVDADNRLEASKRDKEQPTLKTNYCTVPRTTDKKLSRLASKAGTKVDRLACSK